MVGLTQMVGEANAVHGTERVGESTKHPRGITLGEPRWSRFTHRHGKPAMASDATVCSVAETVVANMSIATAVPPWRHVRRRLSELLVLELWRVVHRSVASTVLHCGAARLCAVGPSVLVSCAPWDSTSS